MVVEFVHLDKGRVPVLLACLITKHPGGLRWMGARNVVEESSDEILRGGGFLFLMLSELKRDLVPEELALFRSKISGEHAGRSPFFRHLVITSGLSDVIREAAVMGPEFFKLFPKLVILFEELGGLGCGFEGVRRRGSEEFSDVFPVFERSG